MRPALVGRIFLRLASFPTRHATKAYRIAGFDRTGDYWLGRSVTLWMSRGVAESALAWLDRGNRGGRRVDCGSRLARSIRPVGGETARPLGKPGRAQRTGARAQRKRRPVKSRPRGRKAGEQ